MIEIKKSLSNEYKDYVILQSEAENIWEEAKEKSDFNCSDHI